MHVCMDGGGDKSHIYDEVSSQVCGQRSKQRKERKGHQEERRKKALRSTYTKNMKLIYIVKY